MGLTVECAITPSLVHVCVHSHAAVVTRCVMETVISRAVLFGSTDMPLKAYVVIGKSREPSGVMAAA